MLYFQTCNFLFSSLHAMILMIRIQFFCFIPVTLLWLCYNSVFVRISYSITSLHFIIHSLHDFNYNLRTKKQTTYTLTFLISYFIFSWLSSYFFLLIFILYIFMFYFFRFLYRILAFSIGLLWRGRQWDSEHLWEVRTLHIIYADLVSVMQANILFRSQLNASLFILLKDICRK